MYRSIMILLFTILTTVHGFTDQRGINIQIKTGKDRTMTLYQRSHALVIGVSNYTKGWPKLKNAVTDAEEVADMLEQRGFRVTRVMDPTRDELEKKLNDFIYSAGSDPNDRLLIYFAGHGYTMDMAYGAKMGFIVPADAPLPYKDRVGFRRKAISMEVFEYHARQIQSKHVLYLFDSCFSGSIFALSRAVPSAISYKTSKPVRQFITAGDDGEEVPDKSIFKSQFISGLQGEADANRDGYITGSELGEFLQVSVVNYSREGQHPQYGKIRDPKLDKGDYVFLIPPETDENAADLSKWETYNDKMATRWTDIKNRSKKKKISADEEVGEWKGFLKDFSEDNPHSLMDNEMRDDAVNRKLALEKRIKPGDVKPVKNEDIPYIQSSHAARQTDLSNWIFFFDINGSKDHGNSYCLQCCYRIGQNWGVNIKYGFGSHSLEDYWDTELTYSHIAFGVTRFLSSRIALNMTLGAFGYKEKGAENDEKAPELGISMFYNLFSRFYIYPSLMFLFYEYKPTQTVPGLGIGFSL